MMIGGGSRGKDSGQWDGRELEEPSKRPAGEAHVLWTLSSSPNSHRPPNPTNPCWRIKIGKPPPIRKKFHFCQAWNPRPHFLYLFLNPNKNRSFYQNFKLKIIYQYVAFN